MNNGCQQGVCARFNYTKLVWLRDGSTDRWDSNLKKKHPHIHNPAHRAECYACVYGHRSAAWLVAPAMEKQQ